MEVGFYHPYPHQESASFKTLAANGTAGGLLCISKGARNRVSINM